MSFVSAATEAHFRLIEKRNRFRLERERVRRIRADHDGARPRSAGTGGIKGLARARRTSCGNRRETVLAIATALALGCGRRFWRRRRRWSCAVLVARRAGGAS